jgi:pimeloyl-ACP methyl ester carboxylesterase
VGWSAAEASIVVAFRGSVTPLDWLEDFDFSLMNISAACPGCQVHAGFWSVAYAALRPALSSALSELLQRHGPSSPVLLTGHSLGAALAELAAWELAAAGLHVTELISFGTPRVGNSQWASFWAAAAAPPRASFRVVHNEDPVPRLPPLLLGYRHPPVEVFMRGNSTVVCSERDGEDPLCSDSVPPLQPKDHDEYMGIGIDGC